MIAMIAARALISAETDRLLRRAVENFHLKLSTDNFTFLAPLISRRLRAGQHRLDDHRSYAGSDYF